MQAQHFAGQKQTLVMPGRQSNVTGMRILPPTASHLCKRSATTGTGLRDGTVVPLGQTLATQRRSRVETRARRAKTLTLRLDG